MNLAAARAHAIRARARCNRTACGHRHPQVAAAGRAAPSSFSGSPQYLASWWRPYSDPRCAAILYAVQQSYTLLYKSGDGGCCASSNLYSIDGHCFTGGISMTAAERSASLPPATVWTWNWLGALVLTPSLHARHHAADGQLRRPGASPASFSSAIAAAIRSACQRVSILQRYDEQGSPR